MSGLILQVSHFAYFVVLFCEEFERLLAIFMAVSRASC